MSVLQENKKMLEQELRSRHRPVTRSVGVGDCTVDEPDTPSRGSGSQRLHNGSDFPADIQVVRKVTISPDLSFAISANQRLVCTISSHLSEISLSPLGYDIPPLFLHPVYAPKRTAPPLTKPFIIINSHT